MSDVSALLARLGRTLPARLDVALDVHEAMGGLPLAVDPRDVHPLVVPLAADSDGDTMGLLLWPGAEPNDAIPVVRQGPVGLHFHAGSVDGWLHEGLATMDHEGDAQLDALAARANADGRLYDTGDLPMSGLPLIAYVLLRIGGAPRHLEPLANAHLMKGDPAAALVTADRACRSAPGFARPHAFRADMLAQLGREEEARDGARTALLEPIWTLGARFEPTAELAGWKAPFRSEPFWRLARDTSKPILDRAAHVMDAVCAEGSAWSVARTEVAELYAEAGLGPLADWIREPG